MPRFARHDWLKRRLTEILSGCCCIAADSGYLNVLSSPSRDNLITSAIRNRRIRPCTLISRYGDIGLSERLSRAEWHHVIGMAVDGNAEVCTLSGWRHHCCHQGRRDQTALSVHMGSENVPVVCAAQDRATTWPITRTATLLVRPYDHGLPIVAFSASAFGTMSTNLQDYVELLTAEQHVQLDKLRESARNGIPPRVRGVSAEP